MNGNQNNINTTNPVPVNNMTPNMAPMPNNVAAPSTPVPMPTAQPQQVPVANTMPNQTQPVPQNNIVNNQVVIPQTNNTNPNGPVVNPAINMTNPNADNVSGGPSLNEMNVDGAYNHMESAPSYVNDAEVKNNIDVIQGKKKVTVTITKELKTVIIIAAILFVFIIFMPYVFDLINKIKYR